MATLAAAAVLAGVFASGVAHAEPTAREIEDQIDELWEELEPTIERHNATRIELAEKRDEAERLQEEIKPLQLKVDLATAELTEIAVYTFKGGNASAFNSLLNTGSPATFTDQLVLLDQFSRGQRQQLQSVVDLKEELEAEKAPIDQLIDELSTLEQELSDRAEEIDDEVDRLQEMRLRAYGGSGPQDSLRPAPCPQTYPGGAVGRVLQFACDQIGKPYQWGSAGPNSFDCSGLTMMAWRQAGVNLPHNAAAQRNVVRSVTRAELQPGDLVFYSNLNHIGIYVGGGWIVHAPQAGRPVQMRSLDVGSIHSYGRPG